MNKIKKFEKFIQDNPNMYNFQKTDLINENNNALFITELSSERGNNYRFGINFEEDSLTEIIWVVFKLEDFTKKEKLLSLINNLNIVYKAAKYILLENGGLQLKLPYIARDNEFKPEVLFDLFGNVLAIAMEDEEKFLEFI